MFTSIDDRIPIKQLIASQIEDAILSKKYVPGSKLPSENELCEQFNVSRTSVREALQILVAHGLITVEKGKGIFVNRITSESVVNPLEKYLRLKLDRHYVLDFVHARQMIEPTIAYQAALNHDIDDIMKLQESIDKLAVCESKPTIIAQYDMMFHQTLAEATKNIIIPILIRPIHNMMPELKTKVVANVDDAREKAVEWHLKILTAVKNGDANEAYNCMVEHLKIAEEHASKMIAKQNNEDELIEIDKHDNNETGEKNG